MYCGLATSQDAVDIAVNKTVLWTCYGKDTVNSIKNKSYNR